MRIAELNIHPGPFTVSTLFERCEAKIIPLDHAPVNPPQINLRKFKWRAILRAKIDTKIYYLFGRS